METNTGGDRGEHGDRDVQESTRTGGALWRAGSSWACWGQAETLLILLTWLLESRSQCLLCFLSFQLIEVLISFFIIFELYLYSFYPLFDGYILSCDVNQKTGCSYFTPWCVYCGLGWTHLHTVLHVTLLYFWQSCNTHNGSVFRSLHIWVHT